MGLHELPTFSRLKKKRKRSTSSSSSVSSADQVVSSSSSSSSSGHKKHKKRKRNRSESSRNSKRHSSKASSHPDQNRKEESYPLPANTSASFLNQKQEMEKLLENQGRIKERERGNTQSSSSSEIPDNFGGRSEDSRDFYSSRTQASSSKTEKPCKPDRYYSSRRDFSGSLSRNSDEKKNLNRKFEKGAEGRKEYYRKWEPGSMRCSASPAGLDYSWKSVEKNKKYANTELHDFSRNDEEQRSQLNANQKKESENREGNYGDEIAEDLEEATLNGKERSESNVKKNLPQNLLTIFNQIAEFEKEKGNKQKN